MRDFRARASLVAKSASTDRAWWKDAGTAAALAWLRQIAATEGYPALLAAIQDAIRAGMAEGEADALALAADKQGAAGLAISAAFTAAYDELDDDASIGQQAKDAADRMTDGAAGDIGSALADQAEADGSEQDMADAAGEALSGDSATADHADWALSAAILAGAGALMSRIAAGSDVSGLLNFVTASDGRVCATCQDLADNGPYLPQDFPAYPHPRCRCAAEPADTVPASFLAAFLS